MKRTYTLFMIFFLSASFAYVADILQTLGVTKEQAREYILESLGDQKINTDSKRDLVKKARKLTVNLQVQGVKNLFAHAKAYTASGLASDYKKWRTEKTTSPFNIPGMSNMGLPGLNMPNMGDQLKGMGVKTLEYPESHKDLLKDRLQYFLDLSAGVDFSAKLNTEQKFIDPEYESKPSDWKMCYRAGKEVVEAARQEAQKWLDELNAK